MDSNVTDNRTTRGTRQLNQSNNNIVQLPNKHLKYVKCMHQQQCNTSLQVTSWSKANFLLKRTAAEADHVKRNANLALLIIQMKLSS